MVICLDPWNDGWEREGEKDRDRVRGHRVYTLHLWQTAKFLLPQVWLWVEACVLHDVTKYTAHQHVHTRAHMQRCTNRAVKHTFHQRCPVKVVALIFHMKISEEIRIVDNCRYKLFFFFAFSFRSLGHRLEPMRRMRNSVSALTTTSYYTAVRPARWTGVCVCVCLAIKTAIYERGTQQWLIMFDIWTVYAVYKLRIYASIAAIFLF